MRAKAKNFVRKVFRNITEFCHTQEPRQNVYLCTNILIYDLELQELEDKIEEQWEERPRKDDLLYVDRDSVKDNGLIHYLLQKEVAELGVYAVTVFRLNCKGRSKTAAGV